MEDLTKYEIARIIGARALQLSAGAPPLVKPEKNLGFIGVAEEEMEKGIIPLTVLRE
jgi:DNA-directed RNA polymerase subunit K/omega